MSDRGSIQRFDVDVYQHGAVTIVAPAGPITTDTSAEFRTRVEELVSASAGRVAIECARLAYVDSAGLETLVELAELLEELGHSLRLIGVNATLRETILITGTGQLFEHFEDANAAARSLL